MTEAQDCEHPKTVWYCAPRRRRAGETLRGAGKLGAQDGALGGVVLAHTVSESASTTSRGTRAQTCTDRGLDHG